MPIITNHKGARFREYSRTPAEKKLGESMQMLWGERFKA